MKKINTGLIIALSGMFAGLNSGFSKLTAKVNPKAYENGATGNHRKRGHNTKYVNKNRESNQKWDFISRSGDGHGIFVNRTTGKSLRFKIANPKSTKRDPVRELTDDAQIHFGLAFRDMNGLIGKA